MKEVPTFDATIPGISRYRFRTAVTPSPTALMVIRVSPTGTLEDAETVSVLEPFDCVTELLLHEAETPAGIPETLRETGPLKEPPNATVSKSEEAPPWGTIIFHDAGSMLIEPADALASFSPKSNKLKANIIKSEALIEMVRELVCLDKMTPPDRIHQNLSRILGFGLCFVIGASNLNNERFRNKSIRTHKLGTKSELFLRTEYQSFEGTS